MSDEFIAHVRKDDAGNCEIHSLGDHLNGTAVRAKEFAGSFGNGDWAELVGYWHDLGKFLPGWQGYIRRVTGFDDESHIEDGLSRPNHSTAGAVLALERLKEIPPARIFAYLVAGHHAGLPDWTPEPIGGDLQNRLYDTLRNKLKIEELEEVRRVLIENGLQDILFRQPPRSIPTVSNNSEHRHLWIRMLFSCLVDADFLDTEEFMARKERGAFPDLEELSARFDLYMARKVRESERTPLNDARARILNVCCSKAEAVPGFFSLMVPTGGGKTLASMSFALRHALKHNKKRVIMAIPYTSIIEQTAGVYRDVFGDHAVLEHHSNIDPDNESARSRLASENWDAPLVVTTNVQLFESLLASRTSACRKLHNIVNSVIILDEAQMLPSEYLKPILSVLRGLVEHFGVTVVLCTATQPALNGKIGSGLAVFDGLPPAVEIIDDPTSWGEVFRRYQVEWPDMQRPQDWADLAAELAQYQQVLCIVNTRKDCQDLHRLMPAGTVHLSANMCGEERSEVLAVIKARLGAGEDIRVISTQLVEAGVDIDFPVVYRALAGIDSIAQAAGRCNREGRLNAQGKTGKVVVFFPPKPAPVGLLRKGEDAARGMIGSDGTIELGPELYTKYFKAFYQSANGFDKARFDERLVKGAGDFAFQFRTFAQDVRLVDDRAQRSVIVYYKGQVRSSIELIERLRRLGPDPWLLRKLQRFIVNVPLPVFNTLERDGHIENIHGYAVQRSTGLYQAGYGLLPDPAAWGKELFLV